MLPLLQVTEETPIPDRARWPVGKSEVAVAFFVSPEPPRVVNDSHEFRPCFYDVGGA